MVWAAKVTISGGTLKSNKKFRVTPQITTFFSDERPGRNLGDHHWRQPNTNDRSHVWWGEGHQLDREL
jgi:hypothetical protein